ncbi:unnamed protein product [Ostreobium quekettii]|uniref:RING-type E3 ubiquitin transferase n=1 Tax=Ostreobium quekettii TaxID=121088 RepID=A0A8S1J4I6_9CHLO|nr:unnamed protein product [Ostreobium quekettii]
MANCVEVLSDDDAPSTSGGFKSADGEDCPICAECYTSEGDHVPHSTRCGHVFCAACIKKWLRQSKTCPICKKRCTKKDLRRMYVQNLHCVDTSLVATLRQEVERHKRIAAERKEQHLKAAAERDECIRENKRLKLELASLTNSVARGTILCAPQQAAASNAICAMPPPPGSRMPSCSRPLLSEGQQRVNGGSPYLREYCTESRGALCFDMSGEQATLLLPSQPGPWLADAWMIRQISMIAPQSEGQIHLPGRGPVRDVRLSPSAQRLCVAIDKRIRVVSMTSGHEIVQKELAFPVLSCAWEAENMVYAGLAVGRVSAFDLRMPSGPLQELSSPRRQGLTSLACMHTGEVRALVAANSQSTYLWDLPLQDAAAASEPHVVCTVAGTIESVAVDQGTATLAVSVRPCGPQGTAIHKLYNYHARAQWTVGQLLPWHSPSILAPVSAS